MSYKPYNKNYIYDECDSNQSYSFGKNDNSNQNSNESNDELDSDKNQDNLDDHSNNNHEDSNDETSDNNDNSDSSNNNFYDDQNKKWKRIKVDNICSEAEGVFTKSELKKFGEEYDVYIQDIRCENKEEILKDENNTDYKWKSTVGHAIIKFVKRRPKMTTQQVRYVTHDEFKVFADNVTNTLNLIVNRIDSMEANFNKKIDELRQEIQDVKSDVAEVKKDIALIKQCPTIKKELSELED